MALTKVNIGWNKNEMAKKVALDIPDGAYVNLGIGMPELVADYVPEVGKEDPELINAGKKNITTIKGACFFHHADSFTMIRGKHIDICVLGTLQVSEKGDLANWSTGKPGAVPAVGGAMDLVSGVKTILVITKHCTKEGKPKIVNNCNYPLTGKAVVNSIYTDLAIIDVCNDGLFVREFAPGVSFDYLQEKTGAKLNQYE